MIKFFRQIRYKLMETGKMTRYFKYAIGEIILVVIGILIAVQINSLYNSKDEKRQNELIVKRMILEVESNMKRLAYLDNTAQNYSKAYNTPSYKDSEKNLDSCYKIILTGVTAKDIPFLVEKSTYNFSSLSTFRSVYDEMLNTGKIYTLKSDSLAIKIDSYYKRLQRENIYVNRQLEETQRSFEDCKHGWAYFKQMYAVNPKKSVQANSWLFDKQAVEYKNLSNHLFTARKMSIRTRERIENLMKMSNELLRELNNYIHD